MINQISAFQRLTELIKELPEGNREAFTQKIETTVAMGIRALVLEHIEQSDKDEFERIVETGGDAKIVEYGFTKIPHFEEKLDALIDKVYSAVRQTITKYD